MTSPYPWIMQRPTTRGRLTRTSRRPIETCTRCGWQYRGPRKHCAACRAQLHEGQTDECA